MALPSQGVRTSWRLILPRTLDAYRTMASANEAAFAHMTEVEHVLMPLLWMLVGLLDTAREVREACAGLNGITTSLAGQLMAALRRLRNGLQEDPWRSEQLEPQAFLYDTNVVILLGKLETDFPRAVMAPAALVAYRQGIPNPECYAASLFAAWFTLQTRQHIEFHDIRGTELWPGYLHPPDGFLAGPARVDSSDDDDSPGDDEGPPGGDDHRDPAPRGNGLDTDSSESAWGDWRRPIPGGYSPAAPVAQAETVEEELAVHGDEDDTTPSPAAVFGSHAQSSTSKAAHYHQPHQPYAWQPTRRAA